ncbi:nitrophenyl compound nitroreductase subunit ArsF family protein [Verrucomicrobiota bacterium]
MKEKVQKWVTQGLLAFVFISIGFALGKEATLRSARSDKTGASGIAAKSESKVIVYYAHANIRCTTCNRIEAMTKQVVETRFADDLAAGRLEWRTANFQEDEEMAKRYDVVSSGVVIVKTAGGKELDFAKLDEVWSLNKQPEQFSAYIGNAIAKYLAGDQP